MRHETKSVTQKINTSFDFRSQDGTTVIHTPLFIVSETQIFSTVLAKFHRHKLRTRIYSPPRLHVCSSGRKYKGNTPPPHPTHIHTLRCFDFHRPIVSFFIIVSALQQVVREGPAANVSCRCYTRSLCES
jgi:heme/copper-type cytochrome/quinol oxidase subunit 3